MKQLLRSKYSILYLVLFIIGLYVITNKVVVPFVLKVVESNVFFVEGEEEEELGKVSNSRTAAAFQHCKTALKEEGEFPDKAELMDDNYDAWALGNRTYIIRSSLSMVDPDKGPVSRKFACKIRLTGGDEADFANWSILGIDFNPDAQAE